MVHTFALGFEYMMLFISLSECNRNHLWLCEGFNGHTDCLSCLENDTQIGPRTYTNYYTQTILPGVKRVLAAVNMVTIVYLITADHGQRSLNQIYANTDWFSFTFLHWRIGRFPRHKFIVILRKVIIWPFLSIYLNQTGIWCVKIKYITGSVRYLDRIWSWSNWVMRQPRLLPC